MDNQIQTPESGAEVMSTALPGHSDLITESFTKSLTSWPLFILLAGTAGAMAVSTHLLESEAMFGLETTLGLTLLVFVMLFANLFATIVAVKYYLNNGEGDLVADFKEVASNGWSYLWVLSLSTLVMLSGFILLIVPGVILSTYLMFALHTRVAESAIGMDALVRSTELVRGHWWDITLRMTTLTIALLVAGFGAGFALGIIAVIGGMSEKAIETASLLVIEPIFTTLGSLICFYALTVLYKKLVVLKAGVVPEPSPVRGWYTILAFLLPVLVIVLMVASVMWTAGYLDTPEFMVNILGSGM